MIAVQCFTPNAGASAGIACTRKAACTQGRTHPAWYEIQDSWAQSGVRGSRPRVRACIDKGVRTLKGYFYGALKCNQETGNGRPYFKKVLALLRRYSPLTASLSGHGTPYYRAGRDLRKSETYLSRRTMDIS